RESTSHFYFLHRPHSWTSVPGPASRACLSNFSFRTFKSPSPNLRARKLLSSAKRCALSASKPRFGPNAWRRWHQSAVSSASLSARSITWRPHWKVFRPTLSRRASWRFSAAKLFSLLRRNANRFPFRVVTAPFSISSNSELHSKLEARSSRLYGKPPATVFHVEHSAPPVSPVPRATSRTNLNVPRGTLAHLLT